MFAIPLSSTLLPTAPHKIAVCSSGVNSQQFPRLYAFPTRLTHATTDVLQISSFLGDYTGAVSRAKTFDAKVQADASAISADYASIVALSVRQAFGATEITISKNSHGSFNSSDVLMFMKGQPSVLAKFAISAHS